MTSRYPALLTLLTLLFSLASPAWAGQWGMGSFENDDALDWVSNELAASPPRAVQSAIAAVNTSKKYLQVTECCNAVAACEVLAAARGKPAPKLPPEVVKGARLLTAKFTEASIPDALKALEKVVTSPDSELRALNQEAGSLEAWKKLMADLKSRLN